MGRVCKGPEEGPDSARVGAGVGDRRLLLRHGCTGAYAEDCGEVPRQMDEGGVWGRTLQESVVSGTPTRWFWFKCRPQQQSVHSAFTGWPSPQSICLPSLKKASEMILWAGQPRCGLTVFQGRLRGPGCHWRREGSQMPLPAVRKLNLEPTPGSFRVVLQNLGTRLPSPLVCSSPEKSSRAQGRPIVAGSEEQDAGEGERKPQQARGTQASPDGKGLPWGRYHTGSWDSGVTGRQKARCSHHLPRPAAAFWRCRDFCSVL